jgi:TatD DNase family protein
MHTFELVDTHCHLYLEDFKVDLAQYMERAREAGVSAIYMPSLDSVHMPALLEVEEKYKDVCHAMAGIHPCYVRENYREELELMFKQLTQRNFAAIGEIGLDYYWDRSYDEQQMTCFREQIRMAKDFKLPIVIHSRSSMNECIQVVKEEKGDDLKGIFHCFSGTVQNGLDIIEAGLLLGIGGVITYKNAGLAEVVAQLPLESMVLETDAPYLTPAPFRGKRNETSYLTYVVDKIAAVKGVNSEDVARITTANAKAVFQL